MNSVQQKYYFLLLIFFLISVKEMKAQEQLVPIGSNPVIKKFIALNPVSANRILASDTLDLPFTDDFSGTKIFPDESKWIDRTVFVNTDFPRNPITIGVATFDGLDQYGNPYSTNQNAQGSADTLTSHPMYLKTKPSSLGGGQYSISDSITVSFYYEKKGWGDAPDTNDSLVLEYFNPDKNAWGHQWFVKGGISAGNDTAFTFVYITLKDTAYLKDGFQLRFRSYGSLSGCQDHWHLDYVRFYKAFNNISGQLDTTLVDVAFTQPEKSLLEGYTSIPWEHFISLSQSAQDAIVKDNSIMNYRVNDKVPADVGFNNRIYDYAGNYVAGFGAINGNIFTGLANNKNLTYTYPVDSIFPNSPSMTPDSTFFTINNYFSNSLSFSQGLSSNDTATYKQEFYNYYSYDDGTAEIGYDLLSTGTGRLAMQFNILKPDTLRAIQIMFVQQLQDVSNKLFTLKVWSSLNPETLIYQDINNRPIYIDSINGFANYVLEQILPVSGTIYIGFQQAGVDGYHLGFDRNIASNSKMFINYNGSWVNVSVAPGTFLMRPVMGDSSLFVGVKDVQSTITNVEVYPNPSNGRFFVKMEHAEMVDKLLVTDVEGRLLVQQNFTDELNLEKLNSGLYLLRIMMKDGSSTVKKIIIKGH